MKIYIFLVLLYGILKGIRDVIKKKALEKSSVTEVLFFYTFIGFLFLIPDTKNAISTEPIYILFIFIKSFFVFSAWILSFNAIKYLPISFYGVIDLSGVLFSTALGVLLLNESMSVNQIIGLVIVIIGLFLVNRRKGEKTNENFSFRFVIMTLVSCILNASSGVMDKVLMKNLNSGQLQYWFMLIMLAMYFVYMLISKEKISIKILKNNLWILILSVLFIIGDKALFIANSMPDSKVTVMTLIKQSACFVTIIGGKIVFKEKNISYRIACAMLIILGIFIAVV